MYLRREESFYLWLTNNPSSQKASRIISKLLFCSQLSRSLPIFVKRYLPPLKMSYLSPLQKFNKTRTCVPLANPSIPLRVPRGMGNFFHLSMSSCAISVSFAAAFRGQSIAQCNYRWRAQCRDHVATSFRRAFPKRTGAKFHGTEQHFGRWRKKKKGKWTG